MSRRRKRGSRNERYNKRHDFRYHTRSLPVDFVSSTYYRRNNRYSPGPYTSTKVLNNRRHYYAGTIPVNNVRYKSYVPEHVLPDCDSVRRDIRRAYFGYRATGRSRRLDKPHQNRFTKQCRR